MAAQGTLEPCFVGKKTVIVSILQQQEKLTKELIKNIFKCFQDIKANSPRRNL